MNHPMRKARSAVRPAVARLPAYAAFGVSFALAAAFVVGFFG